MAQKVAGPTLEIGDPVTLEITSNRCRDLDSSMSLEWLVTNGLGGYASGTVAGANTRRYHGILVAALNPPVERTVTLAKVDEQVEVYGASYALSTNEWRDGTISPRGCELIRSFQLEDGLPVWTYQLPGARLEKRLWMANQRNTTYVKYRLADGSEPATLRLLCLATYRDYHSHTHGAVDWNFRVLNTLDDLDVEAYPGAVPYHLVGVPRASFELQGAWYWGFLHRAERARGLDDVEDLYAVGVLTWELTGGAEATLIASTEPLAQIDRDPTGELARERRRRAGLIAGAALAHGTNADVRLRQLPLAADQFLVRRGVDGATAPGATIIAGYHWFADWGRDTMISLPGLCLETGRVDEAADILRTFARYIDQGMVPNRFPDAGQQPEYNTVDATLWYLYALNAHAEVTSDLALVADLFSQLRDVVDWHIRGTRFNIGVDPSDGLLRAGDANSQLTWMDARVDGRAVTPRDGKPVEINALWYHALRCMSSWAERLGKDTKIYQDLAERCAESFNRRFWIPEGGYLFDVVDGSHGDDPLLRPNQLFAVAMPYSVLDQAHWRSVVDRVERELLISVGLRTLAPGSPGYAPFYSGDPRHRDSAYHQGTVWPWLLDSYVSAWRRAHSGEAGPPGILDSLLDQLTVSGLGSINEVFDAETPHRHEGCIAQAWSVAAALRIAAQVHADP